MVDLFLIAAENCAALAVRLDQAKEGAADGGRLLDEFASQVVRTSCVSINMRPCVLGDLVSGRTHQNIHEWAHEQSSLCARSVDEILAEKLGEFHVRRIRFDDTFRDGRRFRYGTLNIGGAGTERYGQFCVALKTESVTADASIAYLMRDSLMTYTPTGTAVDMARLRQEVATHPHRHHLAVLKHAGDLALKSAAAWPAMVCCNDCYIEAIFLKQVDLQCVREVRVALAEYDQLFALAFSDYTQPHDDATHSLKADFLRILRAERGGHFVLQRV
jgi:hypothetical protein